MWDPVGMELLGALKKREVFGKDKRSLEPEPDCRRKYGTAKISHSLVSGIVIFIYNKLRQGFSPSPVSVSQKAFRGRIQISMSGWNSENQNTKL